MEYIESYHIEKLMEYIGNSRRAAIVSHMKPDGDAMGSCIAMYHFLGQCGLNDRRIVISDNFPAYLSFMTGGMDKDSIIVHAENPAEADMAILSSDLIICLDFNAFHRTDRLETALTGSSAPKILIDHHLNPDKDAFSLIFSETEVSSASELLFHILMATTPISGNAGNLPHEAAIALMTGMTTDTNNFANSVHPSTLMMASALLGAGVDRDMILQNLYNRHSESRLRLMGHMMKNLLRITPDGVAYMVLDAATQKEYHVEEGDTEGFVNMPLSIDKVRMSLLLKEDGDRMRVSIRSKKGTSANSCARLYFNGGGHENAAGGRLTFGKDLDSVNDAAAYIETYTHLFFKNTDETYN